MTWRYRTGDHWAVVGPNAAALLLGDAAQGLAERLWDLMTEGAGDLDAIVEALAREGLAHLPSFVLVERTGDAVRTLIRGTALIRVREAGSDGERTLDARGYRSWREDVVPAVTGFRLADVEDPDPDGMRLPLQGGIVRAAEVSLALHDDAEAPVKQPVPVEQPPAPVPSAPAEAPVTLEFSPNGDEPADEPGLTLDEDSYGVGDVVLPAPATAEPSSEVAAAVEPPAAEQPKPPEEPEPVTEDDYLEWVSGATRLGTVEDAAVRQSADESEPPATPSPPPIEAWPAPVAAQLLTRAPVPAPARPAGGRPADPPTVISSIPFGNGRSVPPPPVAARNGARRATAPPAHRPGGDSEEDTDLTVVRLPSPEGDEGFSPASRVGWLPAVLCPKGHANPPESERCRVCGADLAGAEHRWVERPLIGRLRFAGPPGVVRLTGPLVIGRAPRVDRVSGDAVPEMVTVPSASGDVSRSHLRVAVEGWHVMLVDLNATNGTVVEDPSGETRKLHPGEEKMIVPGTRVVLADDVSFVFEAADE